MKYFSICLILLFNINIIRGQTYYIQPYSEFNNSKTTYIFNKLKKIYPHVILLNPISLPQKAYYIPRKRYKADILLNTLSYNMKGLDVKIGLTSKDISVKLGSYADWGIIGLSICPGNAVVISDFRLRNQSNFILFKTVIHELGHAEGLLHCLDTQCYMTNSGVNNLIKNEKYFCNQCKSFLIKKGWKL